MRREVFVPGKGRLAKFLQCAKAGEKPRHSDRDLFATSNSNRSRGPDTIFTNELMQQSRKPVSIACRQTKYISNNGFEPICVEREVFLEVFFIAGALPECVRDGY